MLTKKQNQMSSPDLTKLQEIVIDGRTKIYIEAGTDPEEAKRRFLARFENKKY